MADSNRRLARYITELQAENSEYYREVGKLQEQVMWDEMYQDALYADFMDALSQIDKLSKNKSEQAKPSRGGERPKLLGEYTITAYCSCEKCCGKRDRPGGKIIGAAGVELTPGVSVASPLPFGTELIIGGKRYVVQDRTAGWIVDGYDGKIIDLYMDSHEAALEYGKRVCEVYAVAE